MLLRKMHQEDEIRPVRRVANTPNARLKATFELPGAQVSLTASVTSRPDDSNNDVMVASAQKWTVKAPKRKPIFLTMPLAVIARPEHHYSRYWSLQHYRRVPLHLRRQLSVQLLRRFSHPIEFPDWARDALTKVFSFCDGIRYYGASQFTNPGVCPASFEIEREGERSRFLRLHGHAKILYNMYSAKKSTPGHYNGFIDIVGPNGLRLIDNLTFREVQTASTEYSVRVGGKVEIRKRHNLLVIPQFKIGRQILSPNQLSEGTFKTLVLLFHIMTENSAALLIEEPEVCIHHGLLSSVLELIKSYSQHKQMILSTHSDYVLDHVKPENVYRVALEKPTGTVVKHIEEAMDSKELSALRVYLEKEGNLGDYWREGGLGDRP